MLKMICVHLRLVKTPVLPHVSHAVNLTEAWLQSVIPDLLPHTDPQAPTTGCYCLKQWAAVLCLVLGSFTGVFGCPQECCSGWVNICMWVADPFSLPTRQTQKQSKASDTTFTPKLIFSSTGKPAKKETIDPFRIAICLAVWKKKNTLERTGNNRKQQSISSIRLHPEDGKTWFWKL